MSDHWHPDLQAEADEIERDEREELGRLEQQAEDDAIEARAEQVLARLPPTPIMTQAAFDELPAYRRAILTCNMPGCSQMVSAHHVLCVEHTLAMQRSVAARLDDGDLPLVGGSIPGCRKNPPRDRMPRERK